MIAGAEVSAQVLASARELLGDRGESEAEAKAKASDGESERRTVARKYLIETFGCQMNYHDSERMAGLLERDGYEPADDEADADVVVVNTCSVREKRRGEALLAARRNPRARRAAAHRRPSSPSPAASRSRKVSASSSATRRSTSSSAPRG